MASRALCAATIALRTVAASAKATRLARLPEYLSSTSRSVFAATVVREVIGIAFGKHGRPSVAVIPAKAGIQ